MFNEKKIDVMLEAQIKYTEKLWEENKQLKEKRKYDLCFISHLKKDKKDLQQRIDKAIEYITSYESADTLMSYENKENNKGLDEKTMIEINRRYLIIQEKLLEILGDKENE